MLDGMAQGTGMEKCVGIEQDRIPALCLVESKIVGYPKAEVHIAADEADGDL